jgi:hypothetical protein
MDENPEKIPKTIGVNGNLLNRGGVYAGSGRPKGVKNFRTVIEEIFALPIDTLEEDLKLKILGLNPKIKTIEDAFNARLVVDALEGDSYSKKEILERMHGKVTDKLDANINSTTIEYTKEERKEFLRKYLSDRTDS